MGTTAQEVVSRFGLELHPEGGFYREVHRSELSLGVPPGYPGPRVALTAIYFLLAAGDFSAFHRVRSEETWVHLAGAPLELVILGLEPPIRVHTLAPAPEADPLAVVPGGAWQAAQSLGDWSLVSCLVAPGFDFADFELPGRGELLRRFPGQADWVRRFTR